MIINYCELPVDIYSVLFSISSTPFYLSLKNICLPTTLIMKYSILHKWLNFKKNLVLPRRTYSFGGIPNVDLSIINIYKGRMLG